MYVLFVEINNRVCYTFKVIYKKWGIVMEEKKIERILNSTKIVLVIVFLLCVASIASALFFGYKLNEDGKRDAKNYAEIIGTTEEVENEYIKLNIISCMEFAEKDDTTDKFCFAIDQNSGWYVAKISKSTLEKIDKEFADGKKIFTYEIKGTLKTYPSEIKSIAVETINDLYKDNENFTKISLLNFNSIFGKYYIEEGASPNSDSYTILITVSILAAVIFGGCTIGFGICVLKQKKLVARIGLDELKEELREESIIKIDKQKMYLTKHYIIGTNAPLKIISYEDIAWMYILHQKTNGIETSTFLVVKTQNGKSYNFGGHVRNATENYELAIAEIAKKNNKFLLGYTPENMKAYKEIIKNNK